MAERLALSLPPRRVAIVMLSALGDAVHVLPVINALKRDWPTTHLTWILQPAAHRLVAHHPAVDQFVLFQRKRGLAAAGAYRQLRRQLRGLRFDLVLNLQVYFKAGLITALLDADVKLGFDRRRARDLNWLFTSHRIPAHAHQHVQDQYFEFLEYLGVDPEPVDWKLGPWPGEPTSSPLLNGVDRPLVSLVIGSTNPQKDWLPERWAELVDRLYDDYALQPVLVGGNSDAERATQRVINERARHKPTTTLGCPLRDLVAILHRSVLVISLDTGPMHMAVALGRPVIALMGYSDPRRIGPYRQGHDLVIDAFGTAESAVTNRHHKGRMQQIAVRDVVDRVELWWKKFADARR
ncbi:MAG: glycosyltransferase family 9 protein [Longimicrobiales bacterium]